MNWFIVIPLAIAALILIVFLALRNQKDKNKFENQLNEDYHKSKDEEGDTDPEKNTK